MDIFRRSPWSFFFGSRVMRATARVKSCLGVGLIDNTNHKGHIDPMDAELVFRERIGLSETEFVEMVVWLVKPPVKASMHSYKYRLAFVTEGLCVVRYDNEAGKGDHKHTGKTELPYNFVDLPTLRADFWSDVRAWREKR